MWRMPFSREIDNLVADFRGGMPHRPTKTTYIPEYANLNWERRGIREHSAKGLEGLLGKIQETYCLQENRIEEIIMRNWKHILGSARAHRCSPERVVNEDTLVVFVGNPTLRNELIFDKRSILKRIQAIPECKGIKALQFRQG